MAEDDEEEEVITDPKRLVLDIKTPVTKPLSNVQRELLRDPSNFSFEEEFYILYDAFVNHAVSISTVPILRARGRHDEAQDALVQAVLGVRGGQWLGKATKRTELEEPPEGWNLWAPEHLDQEKLAWGRTVTEGFARDAALSQRWLFRLREIMVISSLEDAHFMARIESKLNHAPPEFFEFFLTKAQIDIEEAQLMKPAYQEAEADFEEYWVNGQEVPNLEQKFDEILKAREAKVQDQLRFINKRRDDLARNVEEAAAQQGSVDVARQGHDGSPKGFLKELMGVLAGENCGNPHCPIHGHLNKNKNNTPSDRAPLQAPVKALPPGKPEASGHTEAKKEETSTMAIATQEKKKEDEIKFTNMSVQFVDDPNSKHIQLPNGMSLKEGRYWLQKIEDEETRTFVYERKFKGWYPLDAMWAAYKALAELHGFVHVGDFPGMWGPQPPTMMTIDIAYGKTQQIPWGPIEVSGFSSPLTPSIELEQGLPTLVFRAKIRNNERQVADKLMKRTEQELEKHSIYRGRAVEVDFTMFHPNDFRFDATKAPRFWDCSRVSPNNLILPDDVQAELNTSLWGPIRKTAQARKHKIPLRRGVLIDGKYGVGKTLAARVTAKICEDNGWTFLYLKHLDQLEAALYFAKKYEPCVIFAEDVNRIVNGERDADMDKLFNVMDGVDRKDDEVMVVFTTNNIEEIHAGMLRPGRIDSVIKVTPPDAVAARKLVQLYSRDEDGTNLLHEETSLDTVGKLLAGQIPAIIREAVERAKIAAILDTEDDQEVRVRESHLVTTSKQMLLHADLLKDPPAEKPDLVVLGQAIGSVIANGMRRDYSIDEDRDMSDKEVLREGVGALVEEAGRPEANGNRLES